MVETSDMGFPQLGDGANSARRVFDAATVELTRVLAEELGLGTGGDAASLAASGIMVVLSRDGISGTSWNGCRRRTIILLASVSCP